MAVTVARSRALVFGGGGVLGFAWMLGALEALESEAQWDARDARIVVGTSAGSVVAALLGCRLPVEVISRHHQGIPAPGDPSISYDYRNGVGDATPSWPGWRPASPRLALDGLRHPRRISPVVALSGLLPVGRGSLEPVRALVEGVAGATGYGERWPTAPRPWIVAADHRSGRRVVFGREHLPPGRDGRQRAVRRATLAEAVQASCSIPGWYPPTVIDGVPYVDGGAISVCSVDVLRHSDVEEVFVLAPMASVAPDRPATTAGRLERRLRKLVTRRVLLDAARLRSEGKRVCVITPDADDLAVMGANMMNPSRRTDVLESARRTAAAQLRRELASSPGLAPGISPAGPASRAGQS